MGQFMNNIANMRGLDTGLQLAGTFMNMKGSLQEGEATNAYNMYMASQYERTAKGIVKKGAEEQLKVSKNATQLTATQRAIMAANGILDSGSALDIVNDTLSKSELDRQVISRNASIEANQMMEEANMARYSGKNALLKGKMNAANSLLAGASQVSDSWLRWKQTGYKAKTPKGTFIDPSNPNAYDVNS